MFESVQRSAMFNVVAVSFLCVAGAIRADEPESEMERQRVVYELTLADPVFTSQPARAHKVFQFRDSRGFPLEYAMSLATHICNDKQCKPVDVILYWDALGYFRRLECSRDKPLTKKEHVPFTAEDYAKLDLILKDRTSILGTWSLEYLEKPVTSAAPASDSDLDALSQPTPVTVQESVVKDAVYTSWAMWKWANGEIVGKLRGLTQQRCTPDFLTHALRSEDRNFVDFALQYILEHHPSEAEFAADVFHVLETADREHVALALKFLSNAVRDREALHAQLIDSSTRMKDTYSPMVLRYFSEQPDLPPTTLEGLTQRLDHLPYYQVHLILRLLEQREFSSDRTLEDISRLLEGDNFFVARRASEYLMKQELDRETHSKVTAFRERNRDRL
jgi:hypothetical protein